MLRLEHGDQRTPSRFHQHHPNWPEIVTIYHHRKKFGLVTRRLESHAKGKLSGDQFNVYVANRFVVPSLTAEQQSQMSAGSLTLDILTRQFIHQYFQYQYLIVDHSKEAFAIERLCKTGYIFNQKPYLNPIVSSPFVSDRQILQAFLDQTSCWVPNLGGSFRYTLIPQKELKVMRSIFWGILMFFLRSFSYVLRIFFSSFL